MDYMYLICLLHIDGLLLLLFGIWVLMYKEDLWSSAYFSPLLYLAGFCAVGSLILCIIPHVAQERFGVALLPVSDKVEEMQVFATTEPKRKRKGYVGRYAVLLADKDLRVWRLEPGYSSEKITGSDSEVNKWYSQQGLVNPSYDSSYHDYVSQYEDYLSSFKRNGISASVSVKRTSVKTDHGYGVAIPASATGWELSYSWSVITWAVLWVVRGLIYVRLYVLWNRWHRTEKPAFVLEVVP